VIFITSNLLAVKDQICGKFSLSTVADTG